MTIDGLPVFAATVNDEEDGIYAISLVDFPAVERNWQAFSKDNRKEEQRFAVQDEEQHEVLGVLMRADYPIYRFSISAGEYFITYSKETIKKMSEKMMKEGTFSNVDLYHSGALLPKNVAVLTEVFIKDSEKGISPKGFEDIEEGSLFVKMHIHDDELWQMCKDGTLNGFSLAGWFGSEETMKKHKKTQNIFMTIKETLRKLLQQFGEVSTDKGSLFYEGELAVGVDVQDENGETAADGEYTQEDGTIIVVADGKVAEIREKAEEEPQPEPEPEPQENEDEPQPEAEPEPQPEPEAEPDWKAEVDALKAEIEALKAELEGIKNQLAEPLTPPVVEEFEKVSKITSKADKVAAKVGAWRK